jgi:ubiquinone/menaquinone biosynthesis C-methylase UbiE
MDDNYWHNSARKLNKNNFQKLWREHSDYINTDLISRWLPNRPNEASLKTDIFDEFVCAGLYPCLQTKAKKSYGIDLSEIILKSTRSKYPEMSLLAANVLSLPFIEDTFDLVISNSTIDHFEYNSQIKESLSELYRVLNKGGTIILTMDNLSNPVVALRNKMPVLLNRIRVVPYYVGATLCLNQLIKIMELIGFNIIDKCFIMHCPRAICVAAAYFMKKYSSRKKQLGFLKILRAFEHLSELPTKQLTGYFIAVKATK